MSPILMLALLGSAAAQTQRAEVPNANVQTWSPRVENGGMLWTNDAHIPQSGYVMAGTVVSWQTGPLVYEYGDGSTVGILDNALQLDVVGSVALGPVRLGVDLPVHLATAGDVIGGGAGTGDLAADVKVGVVDPTRAPVGVALGSRLVLPTASVDAPLGDPGLGWELAAYAHRRQGSVLLAANFGHRLRRATEVENASLGSELFGRLGAEYSLSQDAGFSAEVGAATAYADAGSGVTSPAQALIGAWVRPKNPVTVRIGVGRGFGEAIGSPALRVVGGVAYEPRPAIDSDEDGLFNEEDSCPFEPEDVDGFQDGDGCPEPDNDADGLTDDVDKCPDEAEDPDGYEDDDGCIDERTWAVLTFHDGAGGAPEKLSAFVTVDGAPVLAGNPAQLVLAPGTYVVEARAPGFAELRGQFTVTSHEQAVYDFQLQPPDTGLRITVLSEEGVPLPAAFWWTPERDVADVVPGAEIEMPAGDHEVYIGADGYAMTVLTVGISDDQVTDLRMSLSPTKVEVTDSQIKLKEKVFFDTGEASIRRESFAMLDEVAAVLGANPEIIKVRIEGHTDSRGNAEANRKLSQARAESVTRFLEDRGVAAERMQAVGFGEDHPLDAGDTEEAWEVNRRVDIFILERAGE